MSAYPTPIDPSGFPALPDAVPPRGNGADESSIARAPAEVRGALRPPDYRDALITSLWLESTTDRSRRSSSFCNTPPAAIASLPSFAFLPGVDAVAIRFQCDRPARALQAKFELHSVLSTTPIWTAEHTGDAAVALLTGDSGDGSGSLPWAAVTVTTDALNFPDPCPTVHGAPYRLSLTVKGRNGAISTAWTYFDVQVHSIELHWGAPALIPGGNIADVLPTFQPLTARDELALVNDLQATGTRIVIDPAKPRAISLKSTNAAYALVDEWYSWRDMAFERFKARWGDGPRIPIIAKVLLKSLEHPAGVSSTAAALALGPAEFLWDWTDMPEATRRAETAGWDAKPAAFTVQGMKYKENAAGEPPNCLNCHADRGGKRGGPKRVLPPSGATLAGFPFDVTAAAVRTWGVMTKALRTGPHACCTGVVFQPSRMAKDSYELRVFLATRPHKATLDVAGDMAALVSAHPNLPTATTGMMEVRRQVDARYFRKGTNTPAPNTAAISSEYAKGGIDVIWTLHTWTQAEYNQRMITALMPDNQAESLNPVRHAIFTTNARARRKGLTDWKTPLPGSETLVAHPVKAEIANFDQWFGTVAGAAAPAQASASMLTLPGRDMVTNRFIEAAVAAYIKKDRVSNDKKRKWTKLKAAHPAVQDAELRVRFFNQTLTQSERNKLLPGIQQQYTAAGWKGWDVPNDQPVIWADANYNYKNSKLQLLAEEMHLRKVLADAFEGVTLFHYQHFFETLALDGSVEATQAAIGGVAAVNLNADLGLSGSFAVWDHPTNHQRQTLARLICQQKNVPAQGANGHTGSQHGDCTFKDGNATVMHEFGHFLHLPHAQPMGGPQENGVHDQNDMMCVMNYDPAGLRLCGACLLRLRGWAVFQSKGRLGFSTTSPNAGGVTPPDPDPRKIPVLSSLYPDFV